MGNLQYPLEKDQRDILNMEKKLVQEKVADHFKDAEEYKTRNGIVHVEEKPIMINILHSHTSSEEVL